MYSTISLLLSYLCRNSALRYYFVSYYTILNLLTVFRSRKEQMDRLGDPARFVKTSINGLFTNKEPWQIVAITTTTVLSTVWLWELLTNDHNVFTRLKLKAFKLVRKIPAVRSKIDKEIKQATVDFEKAITNQTDGIPYTTKLPFDGQSNSEILSMVDTHLGIGEYNWRNGRVSGAVYYYDPKLIELTTEVYGKASYTNPLHPDIFPGVCKMEAEIVRMTANLFNGDSQSCGTMTTGGTESIIMACKAYRDYAREEHGITQPNIVIPVTAHSAFDKAAQYLGLYVRTVPVDPVSMTANVRAMEKSINRNTIMLVGSAPNYPYGTIDDIAAIGALGKKHDIPVHVDACLGGFVIVFMKRAGYPLKPFDFSVEGVTSISADTHKVTKKLCISKYIFSNSSGFYTLSS